MNPRTLDLVPELTTARLRLRAATLEDAEALSSIYGDPEVRRYLGFGILTTLDQIREKLAGDLEAVRRGESMRWILCERDSDEVAGYVGLFHWSQRDRHAEVGYIVARHLWGQGLMKELLPTLLRFGFEQMGLHRIEARVDSRNAASMRVLTRAGFQQEGLLREHTAERDGFSDTTVLALLEGEWARGAR
jgi:ribosomal-protein-alanine N-acetyltransferase